MYVKFKSLPNFFRFLSKIEQPDCITFILKESKGDRTAYSYYSVIKNDVELIVDDDTGKTWNTLYEAS